MASQNPPESPPSSQDSPTLPKYAAHSSPKNPSPKHSHSSPKKSPAQSPSESSPPTENVIETDTSSTTNSNIEADSWTDDQGYAESTSTSYLTSIASDIRRGIEDNGRIYAAYGIHKPWLPTDDLELDRNDLQHYKFYLLMKEQFHLAPLVANPHKILDLGTGSGIWAMDMADKYPSAQVIGVDTSPVQPSMVPSNLAFELDDIEHDWLWPENSFDFIHGRELIMAIRDWPRLIHQAYSRLKPGAYLQLAGSVPDFRSDDSTLPHDSAYMEMGRIFFEMSTRAGVSGLEPLRWKQYLEDAGYEDVVERVLKIPTNPWPRDPYQKRIGALELSHFRDTIANVFARGYEQILGGDPTYFQVLLAKARGEVLNRHMHSWVPFYVVYGRKPKGSAAA
ncbi:S-adenosyl-L-methionine-dependent methyltransferase [Sodiomyces alkalinus F11]|uniref:S-adenosyl-L-methionine-dependent methyltransferase n=1 Tax=Sodiomyces alkalinus (strain CBS 110278 / VKM F-3762 / F11) TaxID=1314773 RepID=A0A3N2PNR0_SODAK|nr:S-adenosyl-L-methionine-dependent methyltransferase [Sodiomyces alkalinus F11]ROT36133.1 S-adenosyl-L-methionine-dependent methyltransferase [Sodiomyces alkalinus F11]